MLILLAGSSWATTWVVDAAGGGDVTTIRAAVSQAQPGDTVQVRAGTYSEQPITLSRAITLEGVAGSANTFVSARSAATPFTITADVTLRGFTLEAPGLTALSVTGGVVDIEDLVVANSGSGASGAEASAVTISGGTVALSDASFTDNEGGYGAHLSLTGEGELTCTRCVFEGGSAGQGGAVSIDEQRLASFDDSVFRSNSASNSGGAVRILIAADVSFTGCSFEGNSSNFGNGGALTASPGSVVRFTDVDFDGNRPTPWAVYGYGGGAVYASAATLTFSDVRFHANEGWYGGAIWAENGSVDLSGARFEANLANVGGALYADGATVVDYAGDYVGNLAAVEGGAVAQVGGRLDLDASGFDGNGADGDGGALHLDTVDAQLDNVAIEDAGAGGDGGGLWSQGGQLVFDGVRFEGNRADGVGGGLASTGDTLSLRGAAFWSNRANTGGGLALTDVVAWTELDTVLRDNTADQDGGGVWARDSALRFDGAEGGGNLAFYGDGGSFAVEGGSLSLVAARFVDGLATGFGGHVFAVGAPVDLVDTELLDGFAVWGDGGALWADAGASASRVWLSGQAERGGGVALVGGRDGDVWANVAVLGASGGAFVADSHPGLTLRHLDVLGGDAGIRTSGGAVLVESSLFLDVAGTALDLRGTSVLGGYNLFYGNTADVGGDLSAAPGIGNVTADPRLVAWSDDGDADNDVLVPRPGSPLIDAGNPAELDPDGSRADIGVTGGAGAAWPDADGDGVGAGLDCDDADAGAYPGATEEGYDGRDQDCDGLDLDADHDGHDAAEYGGDDCDDSDPWVVGDCGRDSGPDDSGGGDSGPDDGVDVTGTGVIRSDRCGCDRGNGLPWAGIVGVGGLLAGRRRRRR